MVLGVDRYGSGWSTGGLGPALRAATDSFTRRAGAGGATVGVRHLGVRFKEATVLLGRRGLNQKAKKAVTKKRARSWLTGVPAAIREVDAELRRQMAACPEQTYVLAGQAQGADVVHRLLLRLQSTPGISGRLVGAVLVSDGDRSPRTRARLLGTPAAPAGGRGVVTTLLSSQPDVPTTALDVPVVSICTRGDLVCDLRNTKGSKALAAHRSYSTRAARGRAAGAAAVLWARASAWPRTIAGQAVLTRPDEEFGYQVRVNVAPSAAGDVVFEDAAGLPDGATLSPSGLLSGTVSETGSYLVGYRVRNTAIAGSPSSAGAVSINVTSVDARSDVDGGGQATCQVRADATLACAGDNSWGQLGNGTRTDSTRLVQIGDAEWASVSTSGATTCAIKLSTQLFCWGMNTRGQLGIGEATQRWTPQLVPGSGWTDVSAGWMHTCGIRSGALFCWGNNDVGQLGIGNRVLKRSPARVGSASDWTQVTVGGWHSCGLRSDGSASCWGKNDFGQLGTGNNAAYLRPAGVAGGTAFSTLDATWSSTCGLARNATVLCWGQNDKGQLGDGGRTPRNTPAALSGGRQWTTVSLGDAHGCALDTGGAAWCWGGNRYGQLGNGTKNDALAPVRVLGGRTWVGLDTGWMHSCGLRLDESAECWGNNEEGQLTRGDRANRAQPPGVPRRSARQAARRIDQDVVITTFNILGSNHTQPGGGALNYAPGRIRSEWSVNLLESYGSDIVAFQELKADQYTDLRKALGSTYDFYPASSRAGKIVWQTVMWDTSQWTLMEARDVVVPVIGTTRPNAMVRLRSQKTGKDIWVLNVHNSSKNTPERQRERNKAVKIEIRKIKKERNKNTPVVFLGDMNERRTVFCKVTGQTDLDAVTGGSNSGGRCRPPGRMHLDWIFASPEFRVRAAAFERTPRIARITDHSVLSTRTTIPGS